MVINHIICTSKVLTDKYLTKYTFEKIKTKNIFAKVAYSVLVVKMRWQYINVCLSINGKQSVRLEKGTIEFKNYFKQIPVPFKIHVDFVSNLESAESYEGSYTKNIKIAFLVVLLTSLFVLMINLLSQ